MFVEMLSESKKKKNLIKVLSEEETPADILRSKGYKIKKLVPHKNYLEISFFGDISTLDFNCLKNYNYQVSDGKLFIEV